MLIVPYHLSLIKQNECIPLVATLHIVVKVGTEEDLKRQLGVERRKSEQLSRRLVKADSENIRMNKIIG